MSHSRRDDLQDVGKGSSSLQQPQRHLLVSAKLAVSIAQRTGSVQNTQELLQVILHESVEEDLVLIT